MILPSSTTSMPVLRPTSTRIIFALIKMLLTLSITMSLAFVFRRDLVRLLEYPLRAASFEPPNVLRIDSPIESLTVSLTLSFYAGLMLALPLHLYFLAQLFLPSLTSRQQKLLTGSVAVGFLFFLGGVALSLFYILPATLRWLFEDALRNSLALGWNVRTYYSFALHVCSIAGLVCEIPVLLITAGPLELVTSRDLRQNRLYGYAISLVLGGIVSPTPDPVMLLLFAAPIALIFEASIGLLWFFERRQSP